TYTTRGNLLTERDPKGNQVTYSYAAIPNCPNLSANASDLYRTGMQRGGITSVLLQWAYQHKCVSGLPEQATDPNSLVTTTDYDRYGRPLTIKQGTSPNDSSLGLTTNLYFEDRNVAGDQLTDYGIATATDVTAAGDQRTVTVHHYDKLGRLRLAQQFETKPTSLAAAAADETAGIKTETKYIFNSGRNAVLVSNPYRTASDPTLGWTATRRDKLGRPCSVETFDGSTEPTLAQNCAPSSGATGSTQYAYDATSTVAQQTITDPAGAARVFQQDALGRLITVIEDPTSANYTTTYEYNLRDNLTGVTQGATARGFVSSSLNRLLTASNPESGATSYSYDLAGNLVSRTMAGGVTRTSTFDDQHRVLTHGYNDGTAAVAYSYDTALTADRPAGCADTGPKGRLANVTNGAFTAFYFYNQLGHAVCSRQRVQTYDPFDFLYTNTAQGEWATVQYPSGRTLTTAFDDAGRPASLAGNFPYASNLQYAAHGAVGQVTLGNGTVETSSYNGRLQLADLKLGSSPGQAGQGTSDRWWLQNCYTDADPCVGSGPANNGNVRYQRLTVLNGTSVKTVYRYDGLNRLKLANETPTSSSTPLCPD
ncbi:MAG: hypothetical protein ACRD88_02685, partial [Terriglobia bacterium]